MAKWSNNKYHTASGQAALASTLAPSINFVLVAVKLHLEAAGGAVEDFTITADSGTGTKYDVLLLEQSMYTTQDIVWLPEDPIPFNDGDRIDFAYANTNGLNYGLEVVYRQAI